MDTHQKIQLHEPNIEKNSNIFDVVNPFPSKNIYPPQVCLRHGPEYFFQPAVMEKIHNPSDFCPSIYFFNLL